MIRLNVFIQVSEENRPAALETAKELVEKSLKDNGCIAYDIFESATRSDVLMICETWKDAPLRASHLAERGEMHRAAHLFLSYLLPIARDHSYRAS